MTKKGFTFVELIIVISLISIIMAVLIIVINPAQHFARARNAERFSEISIILTAIQQNIADNRGTFNCSSGPLPTSTTKMASSSPNYNIAACLVPTYLPDLPVDPSATGARWISVSDYDTGYNIWQSSTTGRITVEAPAAELGKTISFTR